ncbi:VanZ family protein [Halobacillus seohaensis]|uniref:VanZ family protein n=1 Tax=Halobacillus seohaensis TaxID=447421 RepID=A0ABW2EPE3_9BACI
MKKIMYWLPAFAWMGIIFYSSSTPYEEQNVQPLLGKWLDLSWLSPYLDWVSFTYNQSPVSIATHGVEGLIEFFLRKGAHVGVFLVLTLLFYGALYYTLNKTNRALWLAWVLTVIYAIFDELHQGITPNRTPYAGDVILDAVGGLLGVGLVLFFKRYRRKNTFTIE